MGVHFSREGHFYLTSGATNRAGTFHFGWAPPTFKKGAINPPLGNFWGAPRVFLLSFGPLLVFRGEGPFFFSPFGGLFFGGWKAPPFGGHSRTRVTRLCPGCGLILPTVGGFRPPPFIFSLKTWGGDILCFGRTHFSHRFFGPPKGDFYNLPRR